MAISDVSMSTENVYAIIEIAKKESRFKIAFEIELQLCKRNLSTET